MSVRRVLTLSWEYPPVVEGGLARHVAGLSEAQVRRGTAVTVLSRGGAQGERPGVRCGVVVHRVAEPAPPADLDAFLAWVEDLDHALLHAGRRLAREERVDLVHGHDWLVSGAAASLAEELGVPFVATVHATEHGRHHGWVQRHPQSRVHAKERAMVAAADAIVTCSAFMREHVVDVLDADPESVAVVRNGIEPLTEHQAAVDERARRAAAGEDPIVLLAGRLVHEKGFQVAVSALARIARTGGVGFRVLVAGAGPYEPELRDRVRKLGLASRTRFLGWVDDAELVALYGSADVCVVPSLYEPFGLVALEALRGGCACVVACTGGLREVVPPGVGLRVEPDDDAELAGAIDALLSDPARRERLGRRGVRHAAGFGWDDAARRTEALYAGLVAGPVARRRAPTLG